MSSINYPIKDETSSRNREGDDPSIVPRLREAKLPSQANPTSLIPLANALRLTFRVRKLMLSAMSFKAVPLLAPV